ncbi:hypothetical protein DSL99_863 [Leeuwenhoekiella marinoflava]|uniref:Uncharacterized protein n=2 Tax=Leeuwenhoekiella marinoflava TaxID=988 RepID=A0A4Q0PPN8_9FLAO|nr:hypothetical protein DSL99_863 [Leeuwenhoekiella marinoflava]
MLVLLPSTTEEYMPEINAHLPEQPVKIQSF